jgi:hypothetical protein
MACFIGYGVLRLREAFEARDPRTPPPIGILCAFWRRKRQPERCPSAEPVAA